MFPVISYIDDILPHIEGRDEFAVTHKDDYIVINYHVQFADTFSSGDDMTDAIRRECRGIIFDKSNGLIIRRPYHKFFNLGEKPETDLAFIAKFMTRDNYEILPKLDGSMIAPFFNSSREIIWGTKMGRTDISSQVEKFVEDKPYLVDFVRRELKNGITPIFEWCSPKNRIVLDYKKENLVLTAMRDLKTGRYLNLEQVYTEHNLEVCYHRLGLPSGLDDLVNYTRGLIGEEGFVLRFQTGHMVKIKADEYLKIHKAKDTMIHEKNVLHCVLSNTDDDLIAILPEEDSKKLQDYSDKVKKSLQKVAEKCTNIVSTFLEGAYGGIPTKKDFALFVMGEHIELSPILFKIWDGHNAIDVVLNYCLKFTSTGSKVEAIRNLIGTTWNYQNKE